MTIKTIAAEIAADPENNIYTEQGIKPLFHASPDAKILIIGQAPGQKAQDNRELFSDQSGNRLRDWMGLAEDMFYSNKVAILPMDFYFPGHGKTGDLPPRKGFADKWHPRLLAEMPEIQLTILIGQYAQKYYLKDHAKRTLTETVKSFETYLPDIIPLVHPSPRNQIWMSKNPWFEQDVLPVLKQRVQESLGD